MEPVEVDSIAPTGSSPAKEVGRPSAVMIAPTSDLAGDSRFAGTVEQGLVDRSAAYNFRWLYRKFRGLRAGAIERRVGRKTGRMFQRRLMRGRRAFRLVGENRVVRRARPIPRASRI